MQYPTRNRSLSVPEDGHTDGVEQSLAYYVALQKAGVPTEIHLHAQGSHANRRKDRR
jgi:hypothetical protein